MQKKIFSLTDVFFLNLNSFKFQRSRILLFLFHFFVLVVFVPYHLAFFVEKNKWIPHPDPLICIIPQKLVNPFP